MQLLPLPSDLPPPSLHQKTPTIKLGWFTTPHYSHDGAHFSSFIPPLAQKLFSLSLIHVIFLYLASSIVCFTAWWFGTVFSPVRPLNKIAIYMYTISLLRGGERGEAKLANPPFKAFSILSGLHSKCPQITAESSRLLQKDPYFGLKYL